MSGSARGRKDDEVTKKYKSAALAAVHESMSDLHKIGMLDGKTMREFDRACLSPQKARTPYRRADHSSDRAKTL